MKKRTPRVHLTDMLDSISAVIAYANQLNKEQFSAPGPIRDGIVLRLVLVGEFAYQLGDKWRSQHPEVEWGSIMGMRNRLLHGYTVIDSDVVWDTIHNDLPDLERQLREILQNEP